MYIAAIFVPLHKILLKGFLESLENDVGLYCNTTKTILKVLLQEETIISYIKHKHTHNSSHGNKKEAVPSVSQECVQHRKANLNLRQFTMENQSLHYLILFHHLGKKDKLSNI